VLASKSCFNDGSGAKCRRHHGQIYGQSKGFGFVEMTNADDASKAIEQFNDSELKGRNVKGLQGYQWWHVAYKAEADARVAIAKACREAQIVEAKRATNAYHVKDGASYQLPNTVLQIKPFTL
jgi:hypothetical protein